MTNLVVSPDAVIRWRAGCLCVGTGLRPDCWTGDNPQAVVLLHRFAKPSALESILAEPTWTALPAAEWIAAWRRLGILQLASRADTPTTAHTPRPTTSDHAAHTGESAREAIWQQLQVQVASLANLAYRLSGDLQALGPWLVEALEQRSGLAPERQLLSVLAALDSLRAELALLREPHLARQQAALARSNTNADVPDPATTGLKLHLGCGTAHVAGWVNLDFYPAPWSWNLAWGLPFSTSSVQYVYLAHVLEHFYYPDECLAVLREIRRVLAAEGVVRVVVPDIQQCLEAYVRGDREFFAARRAAWPWWPASDTPLADFLTYAGAPPGPDAFDAHKYGYDFATLEQLLSRAGFRQVVRSQFQGSAHQALQIDNCSRAARATHQQTHYSLFVEASGVLLDVT